MVGRTGRVRKGLTEETWIRGERLYGQKALSDLQGLVWLLKSPCDAQAPSTIFHSNAVPTSIFLLPEAGSSFTLKKEIISG